MTFSNIGKQRRLDRIIAKGKTIIVPTDDSVILGPQDGLFDLSKTINAILKGEPNAILGFKNGLEFSTLEKSNIPFIYNITASTVLNSHTKKVLISNVESALIAGADCIAAHINFSSKFESEMLHNFSLVANECDKYGMPLLAIAYPRCERNNTDYNYEDVMEKSHIEYAKLVSHCARVVCELGADIVKTHYTGDVESFKTVVESTCGKPVVISGGPQVPIEKSLQTVVDAIKSGAVGISFGRNVFNSRYITEYLTVVKEIVFKELELNEALNKYYKLIGDV